MRKAGLMFAVICTALADAAGERALAQAGPEHCRGLRENMTVGGNDLQPTPEELRQRLIEAGCPPSAASVEQTRKETKEVDQLYNELMKESGEDLRLPSEPSPQAPPANP
jgi:hypothetical protein